MADPVANRQLDVTLLALKEALKVIYGTDDNGNLNLLNIDENGAARVAGSISGSIAVEVGHGKALEDPAVGTITTATTTEIIAAGGANVVTYVYGYALTTSNAGANGVTIKRGTTAVTPIRNIQSNGAGIAGIARDLTPDGFLFKSGTNEAINITTSEATDIEYELNYWQELEA